MGEKFRNVSWKEALRGVKPAPDASKTTDSSHEQSHAGSPDVVVQDDAPVVAQPESELSAEGLSPEDQTVFDVIKRVAKLQSRGRGENRYWRVRDVIRDSRRHEVDYELDRWLSTALRPVDGIDEERNREKRASVAELAAVLEPIRYRGWISEARNWLESATANGMKYGRGTRELRIVEAQKWADKAGKSLQDIIDEYRIDLKL